MKRQKFSREYSRMFEAPSRRDIVMLRVIVPRLATPVRPASSRSSRCV